MTSHEEYNARRFVWANGLQGIGDQIVAAKTVLPWLFTAAGVPALFTAFLVPIRESGSMLPQAALSPWVTSQRSRKWVWLVGSWGQAASAGLIALSAALLSGAALGVAVVILLAALSIFRALCSISGKDVQGRTVSKGRRGLITGRATALSGAVTLAISVLFAILPNDLPRWVLVTLLAAGASTWAFASLVFRTIKEPEEEPSEASSKGWARQTWDLIKDDRDLQKFLIVRSLMLVTALSTPFIVVLAQHEGTNLSSLGGFILASGGAALVGGKVSGMWADKSSKNAMAWAAGTASVVLVLLVMSGHWLAPEVNRWIMPIGFFLVNLAHTTVRVGRKTYLVDMAEGDRRTMITGAANTAMGIVLLIVGAISSAISTLGPEATLLFLAAVGAVGVWRATGLKDVSANSRA